MSKTGRNPRVYPGGAASREAWRVFRGVESQARRPQSPLLPEKVTSIIVALGEIFRVLEKLKNFNVWSLGWAVSMWGQEVKIF